MRKITLMVGLALVIMTAKAQDAMPAFETDTCSVDALAGNIHTEDTTGESVTAEDAGAAMRTFGLTMAEPDGDNGPKYYRNFLGEKCLDLGEHKPYYYNWKRDVSYAGIPLFLSSFIIKEKKKAFRSARFDFQNTFKTEIDNYTQFAPYLMVVGLKAAGVKGRSDWPRMMTSALLSNVVMAAAVNATKYSVKEMRPDNSTRNSFPSGHTATAFVAATVLHKEYGLTRSPWYSIGGYAVATATGVMRVLNNRHWISDVMAGAGIGILSTELGYFAADLIMGNRGIQHLELDNARNTEHPSFFDVQMGVGVRPGKIDFNYDDPDVPNDFIDLGTSTSFGVEGAYFINKYLGFGGLARVTTTPAKGLNLTDSDKAGLSLLNKNLASYTYNKDGKDIPLPGIYSITIADNNFTDASLDVGVYGNLPLGKYFSLGAKFLIGTRLSDGIKYTARNGNPRIADYSLVGNDGVKHPLYWFVDGEGQQFMANDILMPGVQNEYNLVLDNETKDYDYVTVKGTNSFNYVTGISCTWHYKANFAWKVYVDFDSSKNKYTYKGRYFSDDARRLIENSQFPADHPEDWQIVNKTYTGQASKFMNLLTIGGAFTVTM